MKKYPIRKMILLDSLSKRYSLCGARLGMIVSLNKDITDGTLRMAQGRLSSGYVDQAMAEKLIEVEKVILKQFIKNIRLDVIFFIKD